MIKNKMNKKAIANPILMIIVIIAIVAIIYYGFIQTGMFIDNSVYSTKTELISSDATSATYKFSFVSEPSSKNSDCDTTQSQSINLDVSSTQGQASMADFSDGLADGQTAETTDVQYYGINGMKNICSHNEQQIQVDVQNPKAKCTISKNIIYNGVQKATMHCVFTGTAIPQGNVAAKIYGLSSGEATIRFLKGNQQTVVGQPADVFTPISQKTIPTSQSTNETPNCYANVDCNNVCTTTQMKTCTSGKCYCSGMIAENQPVVTKLSIIDQINKWIQSIIDRINSLWKK